MKQKLTWLVLGISLLANLFFGVKFFETRETNTANVARVIDGDTFDTALNVRIKLWGIDTPEYPKGCLSKRAKDRLEELVLAKKVRLEELGKDNFGRTLAKVWQGDLLINKALVTEGLAALQQVQGKLGADELELAEQEAMAAKRGIWSSECTAEQAGCVIKGNFHQGTKDRIYHLPECYNYKQININPNEGDRWFCGEAEAEAAGFSKSKDCPREK